MRKLKHSQLQSAILPAMFLRISNIIFLTVIAVTVTLPARAEPVREIKIGGIFDLSGAGKQWGVTERNAVLLAIEEFNANNFNFKVSLIIEDSGYSNRQSVTAFQRLTSVEGTRYIIGPTWETFVAIMPLCERNQIICISPSCNNGHFDNKNKFAFTLWFDERQYSAVHLKRIEEERYERIAVFAGISPYYDSLVDTFLDGLPIKPISTHRFLETDNDFRAIISRAPKKLDAILVLLLSNGQLQTFIKQWVALRADRPHFYSDDNITYLEPTSYPSRFGMRTFSSIPVLRSNTAKDFNKLYQKRYGEDPMALSGATAMDSARLLLECTKIHDPDTEAVRSCLASMKNWQGYSGEISFINNRVHKRQMISVEKH